jgi:hypothetical protein
LTHQLCNSPFLRSAIVYFQFLQLFASDCAGYRNLTE